MRITAIHTRLMRIPFTELLRAAYGARTHASYLLVTIETDEGLLAMESMMVYSMRLPMRSSIQS